MKKGILNIYILSIGLSTLISGCVVSTMVLVEPIKVNDSISFDATEVTLADWLSYYTWTLEHKGIGEAQKVLPDSNAVELEVWQYISKKALKQTHILSSQAGQPIGYFCDKCDDFIKYDRWLETIPKGDCPIRSFPITGVTYGQVIDFCNWRTKVSHEDSLHIKMPNGKAETISNIKKINSNDFFTLPTEAEWKYFALKGLKESEIKQGFKDSLVKNKCRIYNYKVCKPCMSSQDSISKQYGIGRFGIEETKAFDVFGNVSEMTITKGISKGGNYMIYASKCHPDSTQKYIKPEKWLGFRCILRKTK